MQVDVKKDLSTLTTVNELAINRLFDKINWIISDAVEQAQLSGDNTVELDLGFGTVKIIIEESTVKYKFIPDKFTEKAIIDTIVNGKNQLSLNIESTLVNKLTNIYKEMF